MIIKSTEPQLQHMYRQIVSSTSMSMPFMGAHEDSAYCIDSPIEVIPSGGCINDGAPKQGIVFNGGAV